MARARDEWLRSSDPWRRICFIRMNRFRVRQIDHVEFFVPDPREAAAWYQRVLGLEIVPEFVNWAADARGPLMISTEEGSTKLALFKGEPQASRSTAGFHRVAFVVNGDGFQQFLDRLDQQRLSDERGRSVTSDLVVDHTQAFSIYFSDPYGHRLEVTTYDHAEVRAALKPRA
jgi:catechol 2,3-dioxygenase